MTSKTNENSNNDNNKVIIGFWDFLNQDGELVQTYESHTTEYIKYSPFPKRIIDEQHFNFFFDKLGKRIRLYENSSCFGFLEKFYYYFNNAYKSENYEEYDKNFYFAKASLQLFSFCYEKNVNKNIRSLTENSNGAEKHLI